MLPVSRHLAETKPSVSGDAPGRGFGTNRPPSIYSDADVLRGLVQRAEQDQYQTKQARVLFKREEKLRRRALQVAGGSFKVRRRRYGWAANRANRMHGDVLFEDGVEFAMWLMRRLAHRHQRLPADHPLRAVGLTIDPIKMAQALLKYGYLPKSDQDRVKASINRMTQMKNTYDR
ncbi:MAG: hypothetical protein J7D61_07735 [Marichromatium sp.]|nr:hypothetical protein [Marichromatium sp.]